MSNPILGLTSKEVSIIVKDKLLSIINNLDNTDLIGLDQRFDETNSCSQAIIDAISFLEEGDLDSSIIMFIVSELFKHNNS